MYDMISRIETCPRVCVFFVIYVRGEPCPIPVRCLMEGPVDNVRSITSLPGPLL
jgi:hypothetical protein